MSYKGYFKPKNPGKYRGNPTNIIYRSLWELKLMMYLDSHKDVLEWASEEMCIPYRSPVDGKIHRYFPDFYVKKTDKTGTQQILIEVKPLLQTKPPVLQEGAKSNRRFINELKTYGINTSKWKAAQEFCKSRGWKFMVMTERELGIKF